MKTTGVFPEALAASISRVSRSETDAISHSPRSGESQVDPIGRSRYGELVESNVSYPLRAFSASSRKRKDDAEHRVSDRRLAEGSAVGGEFRQVGLIEHVAATGGPDKDGLSRAYATPKIAPICTWSTKPMGHQYSPRVTSSPRTSTSSYLESKRRWSRGCSSVITIVATAPATPLASSSAAFAFRATQTLRQS